MSEVVLEMKNISKEFPGVKALDNVSLTVHKGEVHALMGENGAGKSTLMKCLFGLYKKDGGEIWLNGEKTDIRNPHAALELGISMVQQELEQMQMRTISDNIWLGRYPRRGIVVDDKRMDAATRALLKDVDLDLDPKTTIGKLSVSMRQMVDIAKAISYNSKIIVLDEPTSSLTEAETKHLFRIIKKLSSDGCGIIYISHKIDEVLEIADNVTVLRDGMLAGTAAAKDLDKGKLVTMMVARKMDNMYPPKTNKPADEVVLKVENLTSVYAPRFEDCSFELHKGEILGVSGLVGARRTEMLEAIFGLRKIESGKVYMNGEELKYRSDVMIHKKITLLTEERRATGIFALQSVENNLIAASIKKHCSRLGIFLKSRIGASTKWCKDALNIKTPSMKTPIVSLSGGNQQKVILGRALLSEPEVLLMDEPTRGIDVGAKFEIYQLMIDLANQGKAIIFVSSEMPELIGVADRILVMSNGHIAGIVDRENVTAEEIMRLSVKCL